MSNRYMYITQQSTPPSAVRLIKTHGDVSTGTRSNVESAETTRLDLWLCPSASRGFALVISYYTIAACLADAHATLTHVYLSPIAVIVSFPGKFVPIVNRPRKFEACYYSASTGSLLFHVIVVYRNLSRAIPFPFDGRSSRNRLDTVYLEE